MSRDLFGFDDPTAPSGKGMTQVALHLHREGRAAWLLSDTGKPEDAKWLAYSVGHRGEGKDENVWTLPEWKAKELGWV